MLKIPIKTALNNFLKIMHSHAIMGHFIAIYNISRRYRQAAVALAGRDWHRR
jgi:hypothetical protein